MRLRINLKAISKGNGYNVGDKLTLFNDVFDRSCGIAFFQLDRDLWEVESYDMLIIPKTTLHEEAYENDTIQILKLDTNSETQIEKVKVSKDMLSQNWITSNRNYKIIVDNG